jgi:DNA-binding NtrC family response regulator
MMGMHFRTVPIELARRQTLSCGMEKLRPVVLLVDDEPLIAETMAAILNFSGFAAMTATDGFAALEIARLIPPQLLIADVAMPGFNGLDLAIAVTRTAPDCEVILITGQANVTGLVESCNATQRDFALLMKPIHPTELLKQVYERLSMRGYTSPSHSTPN